MKLADVIEWLQSHLERCREDGIENPHVRISSDGSFPRKDMELWSLFIEPREDV